MPRLRKNSLNINSANRTSKSPWKVKRECGPVPHLLFQFCGELTVQRTLIFRGYHLFVPSHLRKRYYVPGLFKSHLPWWLLSSSAGMHVLDWDELTNESQCYGFLTHRDSHDREPTKWHDLSPCPYARIATELCYFIFSNFIEVDSLSTKNFKAVILNLNFNFNSNGHV